MKWQTFFMIALLVTLTSSPLFALTPDSLLNKLSAAEKAAGWVLLFDGVDKNAHWRTGLDGTTNTWIIEDGTLVSPSGSNGSEIFTKQTYSNFELSMEWKLNIKGNSGIFFRVNGPKRLCSGSEYAILDDANGDDRTEMGYLPGETDMPIKRTASNYDLYPTVRDGKVGSPYVALSKPYGQWNQGRIWANGKLIENWLNGEKVVEYEIGSPDWVKRFELSKYYNQCKDNRDTWSRHPSGLIGMQDHGHGLRAWFRNIKIRPFTPGEKLVSPLISPAGGNFNTKVMVALETAITGSSIHYTLDGSVPNENSPVYQDSLAITATTTLKAVTIRKGFITSDPKTVTFTSTTAGIHPGAHFFREPEFRLTDDRLRIANSGKTSFTVDIVGMDGKRKISYSVKPGEQEFTITGLRGVHMLQFRQGNAVQSRKIPLL